MSADLSKRIADRATVDPFNPETWEHLVVPFEELTQEQKDEQFIHHAATGGDLIFLSTGQRVNL